jgi:hypothetical protein
MRLPRTGVALRTAPRVRLPRFTINTHIKLLFAGDTHQIYMNTKNALTAK